MKSKTSLILAFIAIVQFSFAQQTNYQLSSHILDITTGTPAKGIQITLSKKDKNDSWTKIILSIYRSSF